MTLSSCRHSTIRRWTVAIILSIGAATCVALWQVADSRWGARRNPDLELMRAEVDRLEERIAALDRIPRGDLQMQPRHARDAAVAKGGTIPASSLQKPAPSEWADLSHQLADYADHLELGVTPSRYGIAELKSLLQRASAREKLRTPFPFFDRESFHRFTATLWVGPLGLSPKQQKELAEHTEDTFDRFLMNIEPEDLLPVEHLMIRDQAMEALRRELEEMLSPTQSERWRTISNVWVTTLQRGEMEIVVHDVSRDGLEARIASQWRDFYPLDAPAYGAQLESLAERYSKEVQELLLSDRGHESEPHPRSSEDTRALDRAFLEIQHRHESQLANLVEPTRLRQLRLRAPVVIRFHEGSESKSIPILALF